MKFDPTWDDARKRLLSLSQEKGISLAAASQVLGRNKAYLQQFLKRGSPVALAEGERLALARLFGVSPDEFRGATGPEAAPLPSSIDARRLRHAIVSTLETLLAAGQSLDRLPPQDIARAILRTYELMEDHAAGRD